MEQYACYGLMALGIGMFLWVEPVWGALAFGAGLAWHFFGH